MEGSIVRSSRKKKKVLFNYLFLMIGLILVCVGLIYPRLRADYVCCITVVGAIITIIYLYKITNV